MMVRVHHILLHKLLVVAFLGCSGAFRAPGPETHRGLIRKPSQAGKDVQGVAAEKSRFVEGKKAVNSTSGTRGAVPIRGDPSRVRLLSVNTWQDATTVANGFDMLVDVIFTTAPDVVVLSEVRNFDKYLHTKLQSALVEKGQIWHGAHLVSDVAVLSWWPIDSVEHVADTVVAFHLRTPSRLCVCAAHLDYHHYAVMLPRGYDANIYSNGAYKELDGPVKDVARIQKEDKASKRGPAVQKFLSWAKAQDFPIALAGDFNEPSHLDWTAATAATRDHQGLQIRWQNSVALEGAGFRDSWREVFPNPVTHPGSTWPSQAIGWTSTSWAPKADERERIDFVYHNRGLVAANAWLVGSRRYYIRGSLTEADTFDQYLPATLALPWPSDHKGVLAELAVAGFQNATLGRAAPGIPPLSFLGAHS